MMTFETIAQIDRPRQEVCDFISDPANDALYRKGAELAEWTSEGPTGVGSTMRTVDRVTGRKFETTSEITVWDPPVRYAFRSAASFPAEISLEFETTSKGTRVTSRTQIEFKGLFKVMEWLFGKQTSQQSQDDFVRLKQPIEEG